MTVLTELEVRVTALEHDRELRYQHASDVRTSLELLRSSAPPTTQFADSNPAAPPVSPAATPSNTGPAPALPLPPPPPICVT